MPADTSRKEPIPYRQFGRHSDQVSIIGIGGFHLGQVKTVTESVRIVHEAIDAGINFLDNAWDTTMAKANNGWGGRLPTVESRCF